MARWAFSARRLFGGRGCKADGHDSPTQVISTGTIRENGSVLSVFPFTGRHARRQKEARRAALLDGPHSIEVIHGLLTAMFNDTFRRVDGQAERKVLVESFRRAIDAADCIIEHGCQKAMNDFN